MTGQVIKQKRESQGMSQRDLAKKLKVTQCQISYWENGKFQPSIKNLKKLCEIFGCKIEEFIE